MFSRKAMYNLKQNILILFEQCLNSIKMLCFQGSNRFSILFYWSRILLFKCCCYQFNPVD